MWFDVIEVHAGLFLFLLGLLGLVIGSFLNVVIYRLPLILKRNLYRDSLEILQEHETERNYPDIFEEECASYNLAYPPSHCPKCKSILRFWHNIPLFSYLCLRGCCAYCHTKISSRYFIVELLSCLVALVAGLEFEISLSCLATCLLGWFLIVISFIDLDHHWVPDVLSLPLLWIGLILSCFNLFVESQDAILGAVIGYAFLWGINQLFYLLRHQHGMGWGDFKLLAAMGAWLGWQLLPLVILTSSVLGLFIGGGMLCVKRLSRHTPIPFAPFIAVASFLAMIWGFDITQYYLQFFGVGWTNV